MRYVLLRALVVCLPFVLFASHAVAQAPASPPVSITTNSSAPPDDSAANDDVRTELQQQREEIKRLQRALIEQSELINSLRSRIERTEQALQPSTNADRAVLVKNTDSPTTGANAATNANSQTSEPNAPSSSQTAQDTERLNRVEAQARATSETLARQLGSITFSGDIRLQYDSFYNQINAAPNSSDPSVLGNELSSRQRFRLRARLAMRGAIGKEFDWGLRFSTGSLADVISSNQVLTDFYTRKPFALDQAYLTYRPARLPGLRLQGGKFDTPWLRTELTFDNDIQPEGFNEQYARDFKQGRLRNLTFVAWQLPFLERNSTFALGADGRVNIEASRRAGRDLALYGAQMRARFELNPKLALTVSAADLYFSGTQFITPVQFFGGQLQLPVTITIPATATAPAQNLTGQAIIPRDFLVSGNGNLGLSSATNNATNRDGRLSSGFNLVDLIARLDITNSKRFPVAVILNFVTNTQARDVVRAGAGGAANTIIPNKENNGLWAEIQAGQTRARGDMLFNYAFIRIEKDAVLTPFNYNDIVRQSDVRAQRFQFAYAADPRVVLSFTGIVTQRPNGILGAFGATPPGSLNRSLVRLQFDTTFRF